MFCGTRQCWGFRRSLPLALILAIKALVKISRAEQAGSLLPTLLGLHQLPGAWEPAFSIPTFWNKKIKPSRGSTLPKKGSRSRHPHLPWDSI